MHYACSWHAQGNEKIYEQLSPWDCHISPSESLFIMFWLEFLGCMQHFQGHISTMFLDPSLTRKEIKSNENLEQFDLKTTTIFLMCLKKKFLFSPIWDIFEKHFLSYSDRAYDHSHLYNVLLIKYLLDDQLKLLSCLDRNRHFKKLIQKNSMYKICSFTLKSKKLIPFRECHYNTHNL